MPDFIIYEFHIKSEYFSKGVKWFNLADYVFYINVGHSTGCRCVEERKYFRVEDVEVIPTVLRTIELLIMTDLLLSLQSQDKKNQGTFPQLKWKEYFGTGRFLHWNTEISNTMQYFYGWAFWRYNILIYSSLNIHPFWPCRTPCCFLCRSRPVRVRPAWGETEADDLSRKKLQFGVGDGERGQQDGVRDATRRRRRQEVRKGGKEMVEKG